MREETYASIPYNIRNKFLSERAILEETDEMKNDELYKKLRKEYYKARDALDERKFYIKYK